MPQKPNQAVIYRPVPPLLKKLRSRSGLTQRELADRINRTQWWIYRVETGSRRLDAAEFLLYCEGCSVDPLLAIAELREQIGGSIKVKAKTRHVAHEAEASLTLSSFCGCFQKLNPNKPTTNKSVVDAADSREHGVGTIPSDDRPDPERDHPADQHHRTWTVSSPTWLTPPRPLRAAGLSWPHFEQ